MSGFGERFRAAGYKVPKPLISTCGRSMVEHIFDMFPAGSDVIFICNRAHVGNHTYKMEETLLKFAPNAEVITVEPHDLGPVYTISNIYDHIDDNAPVIVNYCDVMWSWDYRKFEKYVHKVGCDGALVAYRGFHPHTINMSSFHAYIDEDKGWVRKIKEKEPFTNDPRNEYASSGTYYFSNGLLLKKSFDYLLENKLTIGGEYYVSMAYNRLIEKGYSVGLYPIQQFVNWGIPKDFEEYQYWSEIFEKLAINNSRPRSDKISKGEIKHSLINIIDSKSALPLCSRETKPDWWSRNNIRQSYFHVLNSLSITGTVAWLVEENNPNLEGLQSARREKSLLLFFSL